MKNVTTIPYFTTPTTSHFGSSANYSRFFGSYFIKKDYGDAKYIYKHIITEVKYEPDELYSINDGYCGRCWLVTINNNEYDIMEKYYIRNWSDIVQFYKEKDLKFIQETH